ncbi:hypothetical protein V6R21_24270 [Limibacter armeniacum]|uniref:hypothetical protein n=1 Tax=Limibacter armeniacum TaxID=466084 RepID=UPI002FE63388
MKTFTLLLPLVFFCLAFPFQGYAQDIPDIRDRGIIVLPEVITQNRLINDVNNVFITKQQMDEGDLSIIGSELNIAENNVVIVNGNMEVTQSVGGTGGGGVKVSKVINNGVLIVLGDLSIREGQNINNQNTLENSGEGSILIVGNLFSREFTEIINEGTLISSTANTAQSDELTQRITLPDNEDTPIDGEINPSLIDALTELQFNTSITTEIATALVAPAAILPVELIFFSANFTVDGILLKWATASEVNNDFFEVERSADGANFEVIGKVEGNGNTQYRIDYEFNDRFPLGGVSYYRLRQQDFNSDFEYSPIVKVSNQENGLSVTNLSGNPVSQDQLALQVYTPSSTSLIIQVMDLHGRVILEQKQMFEEGFTTFRLPVPLPQGPSVLQAIDQHEKIILKLIKQ